MNRCELMKKIQELSFVKCELELFLDTHPTSPVALENYKDAVAALDALVSEYTERFGPITAEGSVGDTWDWVNGPWPWHHEFPNNLGGEWQGRNGKEGREKG